MPLPDEIPSPREVPGPERLKGPPVEVSRRLATVPNLLSALRLATVPVFLWLFISGRTVAAVVLYVAGALTDFVDGFVARRYGQVSELGKLLDPLSDRVFIVSLAVALVAVDAMPWLLAMTIVARDIVLLSAYPLLVRWGIGRIPVNLTGKTATALLLTGLSWLALSRTGIGWSQQAAAVGIALCWAGAALYWTAAIMYGAEGVRRLRRPVSGAAGAGDDKSISAQGDKRTGRPQRGRGASD